MALASIAFTGCRVGPDYVPPEMDLPDVWFQASTEGLETGETNAHRWWTQLEDPILEDLVRRTAENNRDLDAAFARIRQARAVRGVRTGERYPNVDGAGVAERNRLSEGTAPLAVGRDRTDDVFAAGVGASWEIDLWGRISRSIESADAGLQASVESYRDLLVVLLSEVGVNYVEVRALQARIAALETNVEGQRGTLSLTRDRNEAGLAPELDVHQAELNLANTESSLPRLRQLLAQTINRLGVLTGDSPDALHELLTTPAPIPTPPDSVTVGIPAEVIRQRPDVRAAERSLAASTAEIGVATAALYPEFRLNGTFGYEAFDDLLDSGNQVWSFGPSFVWNLFDGGRVRNTIELRDAQTEEALAFYEQTVLLALEEVESSMVAYIEERIRLEILIRSVDAAERSVEQVRTLYRNGLTDFQNVLDTERSLFVQQDALAESRGLAVQNLIDLYRALGGGWEPDPEALAEEVEDQEDGEPIL